MTSVFLNGSMSMRARPDIPSKCFVPTDSLRLRMAAPNSAPVGLVVLPAVSPQGSEQYSGRLWCLPCHKPLVTGCVSK